MCPTPSSLCPHIQSLDLFLGQDTWGGWFKCFAVLHKGLLYIFVPKSASKLKESSRAIAVVHVGSCSARASQAIGNRDHVFEIIARPSSGVSPHVNQEKCVFSCEVSEHPPVTLHISHFCAIPSDTDKWPAGDVVTRNAEVL